MIDHNEKLILYPDLSIKPKPIVLTLADVCPGYSLVVFYSASENNNSPFDHDHEVHKSIIAYAPISDRKIFIDRQYLNSTIRVFQQEIYRNDKCLGNDDDDPRAHRYVKLIEGLTLNMKTGERTYA